jgi:hypothetical protein
MSTVLLDNEDNDDGNEDVVVDCDFDVVQS